MKFEKLHPSLIGLAQAVAVIIYCALVGMLMQREPNLESMPLQITLILVLLVVSATVTGSLVIGYPAYLAMNGKTRRGVSVLVYTLAYFLAFVLLAITLFVK